MQMAKANLAAAVADIAAAIHERAAMTAAKSDLKSEA